MYSGMKYQVFMLYTLHWLCYGSTYSDIFYNDEGDSNRLEP